VALIVTDYLILRTGVRLRVMFTEDFAPVVLPFGLLGRPFPPLLVGMA
jgi:hypothetical protein